MHTHAGIVRHTHNGRILSIYGRQLMAETLEARMVQETRARRLAARVHRSIRSERSVVGALDRLEAAIAAGVDPSALLGEQDRGWPAGEANR